MKTLKKEIKEANILRSSVPKFTHYRDIHKEIDKDNYQICTRVDYQPIELTNDNILETWGRLKYIHQDEITSEYESHAKSGSKYFTTEDGYVYRLSNHWGVVKTCIWTRGGEGNMIASLHLSGPVEIGVAHLSDFQIHRMKNDWKRDLILNPEWVKMMLPLVDLNNRLSKLKHSPEFNDLPGKDKMLIGKTWGSLSKNLYSIKSLEYSNENHIFTQ